MFADQVVAAPDNTIYAVRCAQQYVEQLASDSSTVNQWLQNVGDAKPADNDTCFLAATQKYIALLANVPSAPVLRIFAVNEKHEKLIQATFGN